MSAPHPGFSVKFRDGSWLAYGHGFHFVEVDLARQYREEASARDAIAEWSADCEPGVIDGLGPEVVVAWEPECARLRARIEELEKANLVTPATLDSVEESLTDALRSLGRMR